MKLAIERIDELPLDQLQPLIEESVRDGFRLVRRLADEWEDGTNRFARPGEILLTARRAGRLVGICGLNVDPYVSDARIGRVRRLYVEVNERRRGVGKALVSAIIAEARRSFDLLRLRTSDAGAAAFYETLGFRRSAGVADCTHVLDLRRASA